MADAKELLKNGPWLVKSGDRILGPYSTDDLSNLIREKEVVVIDEVMAPQSRWGYVRDTLAFAALVEEIRRGQMYQREDTEVQGYTSPAQKSAITRPNSPTAPADSVTGWQAPSDDDENDPTVVTNTPSTTKTPVMPQPTPKAVPPKPAAAPPPPAKLAMDPLPHHTREISNELPAQPKQYVRPRAGSSGLILGALVLILAAGFVIYSVLKSPQSGHSIVAGDNLQTQASVAWKRGEFDRALELYRALNHTQPTDPIVAARLATLLMKIEGQTVAAKRVIETALPSANDDEKKSALAIATGLAALQNDDAKTAVGEFATASKSWIASFDQGIAYSMLKDWKNAAAAFNGAGDNAVALLMLARTHLSAGESGTMPKAGARHDADEAIKKALVQAPDYQQESLLLASYIDAAAGNAKRAAKEVLEAVETDPNQTADHFHDPGLSLDLVSWSKLLPYCQSVHKDLNTRVSGAMLGLCLAKANQLEDAMKVLDGELAKDNNNTYLHAVNAYLHILADRDDAARASLTLSTKAGSSRLAQILSSRLCVREKQDACAEDGWSKLASENNPPIAAITGLAQVRQAKGDADAASALLVKAESMSPRYLPLLRLREDASR